MKQQDNRKEFVAMIQQDITLIRDRWMKNEKVYEILHKYNMSNMMFQTHFAPKIFHCCNNTIMGVGGEKKYPIIHVLMVFFHAKVKYSDFALLFNGLRREYLRTFFQHPEFQNLFDAVNDAFDTNLSEIFHEITLYNHSLHHEYKSVVAKPNEVKTSIQKASEMEKTNFHINSEMLDDLEEYEGMLIDAIEHHANLNEELLEKIVLVFKQYGKILSEDISFMKLADAFLQVAYSIENSQACNVDSSTASMIEEYISVLSDELNKWRLGLEKGLIIEDNKSLISNLAFLENMFLQQQNSCQGEDALEWF